jgi:hypothetical protein
MLFPRPATRSMAATTAWLSLSKQETGYLSMRLLLRSSSIGGWKPATTTNNNNYKQQLLQTTNAVVVISFCTTPSS